MKPHTFLKSYRLLEDGVLFLGSVVALAGVNETPIKFTHAT